MYNLNVYDEAGTNEERHPEKTALFKALITALGTCKTGTRKQVMMKNEHSKNLPNALTPTYHHFADLVKADMSGYNAQSLRLIGRAGISFSAQQDDWQAS